MKCRGAEGKQGDLLRGSDSGPGDGGQDKKVLAIPFLDLARGASTLCPALTLPRGISEGPREHAWKRFVILRCRIFLTCKFICYWRSQLLSLVVCVGEGLKA